MNLPHRIIRNSDFLKQLAKCRSPHAARNIIEPATPDQLLTLVEICLNLVQDRYLLSARQKRSLRGHREFIRTLSRLRAPHTARRLLLANSNQVGRGAPTLIASLLIPLIGEWMLRKALGDES